MKVVRRKTAKGLKGARSVSYQMVGPHSTGARKFLVTVVHVQRGGVTPVHEHATCDSMYYIIEGRGEVSDGKEKKVLGADTAVYFPPGTGHGIRNVGRTRLVYLSCHAPPYEIEELYREWAREAPTLLSTGG
ncbi:MAG: cupin domain-containing protein [Candidatus Thermoplasmatota archaeon]